MAEHAARRPSGRFLTFERRDRQRVIADHAVLLLIDDDVAPGRAGGVGARRVLDQPGIERRDVATKALARVLTLDRPRTL
jgi:hypothetical protein